MLFNSLQFLFFFVIVYTFYRVLGHRWQNRLLLIASYVFYGAWDIRFLLLLIFSTLLDFYCALRIERAQKETERKFFFWLSIVSGLTILGFFKYFNFFAENLQRIFGLFGLSVHPFLLHVVLPVGISFYTFQTMSYVIDVYRKKIPAEGGLLDFALFVSFFPQLVAGPIERAGHLLPQIKAQRTVTTDNMKEGCYLIFWGLFQKVFVADNLAKLVDPFFSSSGPYNGLRVLLAGYAFMYQIYCDFAGYSNIARGLGLLMGFDLMVNFNLPFFSKSPNECWERWHISLAQWVRDYVYAPLRNRKKDNVLQSSKNIFISMTLVGLWHGAAWNYVLWGAYQGVLISIQRIFQTSLRPFKTSLTHPRGGFLETMKIVLVFHLSCFGALIFRSQSLSQMSGMMKGLLLNFQMPPDFLPDFLYFSYFISFLLFTEIMQYVKKDLLIFMHWSPVTKTAFVMCVVCLMLYVLILGQHANLGENNAFIYYQF